MRTIDLGIAQRIRRLGQPSGLRAADVSLQPVADGLWRADGWLPDKPVPIRMTVLQLADRRLVLHSALALPDEEARKLEALGPVAYIVVPNALHCTYARWATERFPRARVLAARAVLPRVRRHVAWTEPIEAVWDETLCRELDLAVIPGTRVGETVFLHRASRTLLVTDLLFNFAGRLQGALYWAMKLNGVADRAGMSRAYRLLAVRDLDAVLRAVDEIASWDFDRLIMAHGRIIESGGCAAFRTAFRLP